MTTFKPGTLICCATAKGTWNSKNPVYRVGGCRAHGEGHLRGDPAAA